MDVVEESLTYVTGKQCDERIREANVKLQQLLQTTDGIAQVEVYLSNECVFLIYLQQQMFKTCAPLKGIKDIQNLLSTLMGNFMGTVQYDNEGGPVTIETVIHMQ